MPEERRELFIQHVRRELGLNQTTVAVLADIDQPRLSDIETGKKRPSDAVLEKLAQVLGVAPAVNLLRPTADVEQVQ